MSNILEHMVLDRDEKLKTRIVKRASVRVKSILDQWLKRSL